ncbi:hypothetical protein KCU81_g1465, partial [Aureobasidium melanogenum]|uniref:Uncharacterized protein n=1 Tax=Aureobasidium melanogenum (strain CBS 110374) TaxID=1043003 RepID=A0A074W0H5_AURM1
MYSWDEHDDTTPLQPSRNVPPSRPLERPNRLQPTDQPTTIDIGEAAGTLANTTTEPTKSKFKDGDDPPDSFFACMGAFMLAFIITWIYIAVVLKRDTDAFKENSGVLKDLQDGHPDTEQMVTPAPGNWDASRVTITAWDRQTVTVGTVTEVDVHWYTITR